MLGVIMLSVIMLSVIMTSVLGTECLSLANIVNISKCVIHNFLEIV